MISDVNDLTPANSDSKIPPMIEQFPPFPATLKNETTPPSPGAPESNVNSWVSELLPNLVADPTYSTIITDEH